MFNGPENLRKSNRRNYDKFYKKDPYFLCPKTLHNGIEFRQDQYLSMRKLSNLSQAFAFSNLFRSVFFPVDLFSGVESL